MSLSAEKGDKASPGTAIASGPSNCQEGGGLSGSGEDGSRPTRPSSSVENLRIWGLWLQTEILCIFFCNKAPAHRPGSRAGGSE